MARWPIATDHGSLVRWLAPVIARMGNALESRPIENFQFTPVDRQQLEILQSVQNAADRFQAQTEVAADVVPRHLDTKLR